MASDPPLSFPYHQTKVTAKFLKIWTSIMEHTNRTNAWFFCFCKKATRERKRKSDIARLLFLCLCYRKKQPQFYCFAQIKPATHLYPFLRFFQPATGEMAKSKGCFWRNRSSQTDISEERKRDDAGRFQEQRESAVFSLIARSRSRQNFKTFSLPSDQQKRRKS